MNETRSADAERFERGLQQHVAGEVVGDDIAHAAAFGRGIFEVPHVDVKAAAVEQKAAVAGRLLVIAIVQVDRAQPCLAKEDILHPRRPGSRRRLPAPLR